MPRESQEVKRARKAAAKAAARARAARITAGETGYLKRLAITPAGLWLLLLHTIVHAPPRPRAKVLIPPLNTPLRFSTATVLSVTMVGFARWFVHGWGDIRG